MYRFRKFACVGEKKKELINALDLSFLCWLNDMYVLNECMFFLHGTLWIFEVYSCAYHHGMYPLPIITLHVWQFA